MAELWKEKEVAFVKACDKLGLPVKVSYAPFQNNVPNIPMNGNKPGGLTIHETGNFSIGARAMSQRGWVANQHGGGPPNLASFTMSVDDGECVLICRLNYRNYHAGVAVGNATHGSMEICVNRDRDADQTNDNAAKAAAAYLFIWDLEVSAIVQHNIWYGKDCPFLLRRHGWGELLIAIEKYLARLKGDDPPVVLTVRQFPLTGHILYGEFKKYFEAHGDVPTFGFPVTDTTEERIGDQVYPYVQWFERARMEWHSLENKVELGNVGEELLEAKRRPVDPEIPVAPRFTEFYAMPGVKEMLGAPIEEERLESFGESFYHVQYFQRGRLEWDLQTEVITRGRVGAEARDALLSTVANASEVGVG